MFNKYYFPKGPNTQNVNVKTKEYKAPTDESIRLMMEMEKKALDNLVNRFDIQNNVVNGSVFVFEEFLKYEYVIISKFKINGKEFKTENRINQYDFTESDARKILYENVSKEIFLQLMESATMPNQTHRSLI